MRCYYCDFCPTAPSISTLNEKRSVKLYWDEELKGWTCQNSCRSSEEDDTNNDIFEVLNGSINSKPVAVSE